MIRIEKAEMSMSIRYSGVEGNSTIGIVFREEEKEVRWWLGIG